MEKVIFDTNFIRNTEPKQFLGGRNELKKFAKVAEIIFPDIVIEEIKNQKRKNLEKNRNSFLGNPFHWIQNLDRDETKSFDIESHISGLVESEVLKYQVIQLTDYSVLEQMKKLALKKMPPFEAGDHTDKGFKDAYVYFTILEYIQSIPDKTVFVCTKDGRLKEALEKEPSIMVIEDYRAFKKYKIDAFTTDYFLEKLKTETHSDMTEESIIDYWINTNENHVLLIETDSGKYVVEVDSGEIVDSCKIDNYSALIKNLIISDTFEGTITVIETLHPYIHFLSDDEIIKIFKATQSNEQIYRIFTDTAVKQFISILYEKKKGILTPELEANIKEKLE